MVSYHTPIPIHTPTVVDCQSTKPFAPPSFISFAHSKRRCPTAEKWSSLHQCEEQQRLQRRTLNRTSAQLQPTHPSHVKDKHTGGARELQPWKCGHRKEDESGSVISTSAEQQVSTLVQYTLAVTVADNECDL